MRSIGLDIGERRVGVAVSDPSGRIATPLKVLDAHDLDGEATALRRLIEDYEAEQLVVGLPLTLAGEEGQQARLVKETALRVGRFAGLPVVFVDERLTSAQASRAMSDAGLDARGRRGRVDMVAASLLLQAHLDGAADPTETATDG